MYSNSSWLINKPEILPFTKNLRIILIDKYKVRQYYETDNNYYYKENETNCSLKDTYIDKLGEDRT